MSGGKLQLIPNRVGKQVELMLSIASEILDGSAPTEAEDTAGQATVVRGSVNPPPPGIPIVGIGASAGGLAAFEAFFSGMPANSLPGMAFVLVQHLAPDHKSILTSLVSRCTRMQVFEVVDGMAVLPNCVYIIPPNRDMAFLNGTLQLLEPAAPRGQRLPINFFFRSLAQDQHEHAIAIVLSGTGSDGTMGIREIKAGGGMVMAQNPDSTEYDGMPRNAIATNLVDYVLPPAEMPAQLIVYVAHAFGNPPRPLPPLQSKAQNALRNIFVLLRSQTGHDFSQYKQNTIHRRIMRRLAVNQIETLDEYAKYLRQSPKEAEALFRDLLIGVTSFFRDPEAFKALEELVIPKLLEDRPAGSAVRVWSTGCSTGEEPYSIAILLQEYQERVKKGYNIQVFATDIDGQALATARAGLYPASIAADISPERLARFFVAEPDGSAFRIHKSLRNMLVFSKHDVIRDPPFSKLDILSCRNLLIYMGTELQRKLVSLFHYALNQNGILFLGTSETVGEPGDLFAPLDNKTKMYRRKDVFRIVQHNPASLFLPPMTELAQVGGTITRPVKPPLRDLTEQTILKHVVSAGALVNSQGDILYLHGRTGMYLEPQPGEPQPNNILKMAREGLRPELALALRKAAATKEIVRCPGLRVKTNGSFTTINLTICPVAEGVATPSVMSPLLLVALEEAPPSVLADREPADNTQIAALKRELRISKEYLQTTNNALESSNAALKSSNEETQSVNEELQSTNEELETSKEELQSANEELTTVNTELQIKVADLLRANNDMNNLLAGTGIGTVFVDRKMCVKRFTPAATRIVNLILSDVGRPVAHVVSNLIGCEKLVDDIRAVQDTLIPKEQIVQTTDGVWFILLILPYRTLDNLIEGTVLTFVDISERKLMETALHENDLAFTLMVGFLAQLTWICQSNGQCHFLGPKWLDFTGVPEAQQFGSGWLDQIHPDDRAALMAIWDTTITPGDISKIKIACRIRHRSGEYHRFTTNVVAVPDTAGHIVKWIGVNIEEPGKDSGQVLRLSVGALNPPVPSDLHSARP